MSTCSHFSKQCLVCYIRRKLAMSKRLTLSSDEESDGEAFKIVDWFRSSASSMSAGQFAELVTIIERLHRPAVPVLFEYVAPGSDLVWGSQELISRLPHLGCGHTLSCIILSTDSLPLLQPGFQYVVYPLSHWCSCRCIRHRRSCQVLPHGTASRCQTGIAPH